MANDIFEQPETIDRAQKLIKSVGLPSQPRMLQELNRAVEKSHTNLSSLAGLIRTDPSLSAKVIKIANSPYFSSQRVATVDQALLFLGIKNFSNLVLTSALGSAL
ncbi:MAG: HDOD domain-containing protein, partial [Syntrophales bacterium LBB04]|nr:HDOD domain-containing protein [Syntrophales bacterium LBB04]